MCKSPPQMPNPRDTSRLSLDLPPLTREYPRSSFTNNGAKHSHSLTHWLGGSRVMSWLLTSLIYTECFPTLAWRQRKHAEVWSALRDSAAWTPGAMGSRSETRSKENIFESRWMRMLRNAAAINYVSASEQRFLRDSGYQPRRDNPLGIILMNWPLRRR